MPKAKASAKSTQNIVIKIGDLGRAKKAKKPRKRAPARRQAGKGVSQLSMINPAPIINYPPQYTPPVPTPQFPKPFAPQPASSLVPAPAPPPSFPTRSNTARARISVLPEGETAAALGVDVAEPVKLKTESERQGADIPFLKIPELEEVNLPSARNLESSSLNIPEGGNETARIEPKFVLTKNLQVAEAVEPPELWRAVAQLDPWSEQKTTWGQPGTYEQIATLEATGVQEDLTRGSAEELARGSAEEPLSATSSLEVQAEAKPQRKSKGKKSTLPDIRPPTTAPLEISPGGFEIALEAQPKQRKPRKTKAEREAEATLYGLPIESSYEFPSAQERRELAKSRAAAAEFIGSEEGEWYVPGLAPEAFVVPVERTAKTASVLERRRAEPGITAAEETFLAVPPGFSNL